MQQQVIVIGSGVAGMAAAIRLAVMGHSVKVYEQQPTPGGKLTFFEQQGYRFDKGPSLFTQPQNIEELFALAGEPIEPYFSYQPVPVACRYFFENGKVVNAHTDAAAFAEELATQCGEQPQAVINYLRQAEKLYNQVGTVFVNHSLHKCRTWLHGRTFKALAAAKPGYLFSTLARHNRSRFTSAEGQQIFNRFATYNGSNPYKAPAMLSLVPHLEQNQGTFYPSGGMINITNALYRLAVKKGVQFVFNTKVQSIIHHDGKVAGIVVDHQNIKADIVVSNMDVYFTHRLLLHNPYTAKKLLKQERSSSALIFYWGIKKTFSQLHLHNIFFSEQYQQEFANIFTHKTIGADPTVYINITAKMETGQAPAGKENWFVMINAPANTGQDWAALQQQARQAILAKLSRILQTDIEPLIETEAVLDPVSIEADTGSFMGSLYGTSSNSKMAAFMRHPNFIKQIKGLYCCGGSVHPGGGIPLCLKSAAIVSNLIATTKVKKH